MTDFEKAVEEALVAIEEADPEELVQILREYVKDMEGPDVYQMDLGIESFAHELPIEEK